MKPDEKERLGILHRPLYHPSRVRAWARELGVELGDHGRLPVNVIKAYQKAKSRNDVEVLVGEFRMRDGSLSPVLTAPLERATVSAS